jgi:hypothetical protein
MYGVGACIVFYFEKRKGGKWGVGDLPGPIRRVDWKSCAVKEPVVLRAVEGKKIPVAAVVPKLSRGQVLSGYNAINFL